ncbi:histone H2A-like, partial [Larimichthys crocea]|uniref:histone H2A-like n=1 Tax=Larimichthys crocea TaxID=215358 RepID=UPI000F5E27F6
MERKRSGNTVRAKAKTRSFPWPGLQLPRRRVHQTSEKGNYGERVAPELGVLAAVLEVSDRRILELTVTLPATTSPPPPDPPPLIPATAGGGGLAVRNDDEFTKCWVEGPCSGGVMPNIQAVLCQGRPR